MSLYNLNSLRQESKLLRNEKAEKSNSFFIGSVLSLFVTNVIYHAISSSEYFSMITMFIQQTLDECNKYHSPYFEHFFSDFCSFLLASCDVYWFNSDKIVNIQWNEQNASIHWIKTVANGFFRYLYLPKRILWPYNWSIFFQPRINDKWIDSLLNPTSNFLIFYQLLLKWMVRIFVFGFLCGWAGRFSFNWIEFK